MKTIAYIITFNSQNINQNICQQSSRSIAEESGCLGLQLKIGVKLHLHVNLNTGMKPIPSG